MFNNCCDLFLCASCCGRFCLCHVAIVSWTVTVTFCLQQIVFVYSYFRLKSLCVIFILIEADYFAKLIFCISINFLDYNLLNRKKSIQDIFESLIFGKHGLVSPVRLFNVQYSYDVCCCYIYELWRIILFSGRSWQQSRSCHGYIDNHFRVDSYARMHKTAWG